MVNRLGFAVLGLSASLVGASVAQSVIRGSVRNKTSQGPVPGVTVTADGLDRQVSRSDTNGVFVIAGLPAGQAIIRFRAIGFEPFDTKLELTGSDTVDANIQLNPTPTALEPVTVSANRGPKGNLNLITAAEVESVLGVASDGYEVVRRLRPNYLRGRSYSGLGNPNAPDDTTGADPVTRAQRTAAARGTRRLLPKVTIDDGPLQDLDLLRQVEASNIKEIRFLSAIEATTVHGENGAGGVIVVVLKGSGR